VIPVTTCAGPDSRRPWRRWREPRISPSRPIQLEVLEVATIANRAQNAQTLAPPDTTKVNSRARLPSAATGVKSPTTRAPPKPCWKLPLQL
jgi:hypothetical protein